MKIFFYSAKSYDEEYFLKNNQSHNLTFSKVSLCIETVILAKGYNAVCIFVNDICDADVIDKLYSLGIKNILLRCAGFNNVDISHTKNLGMNIAKVPAYSPFSVAEHALGLLMCLNRKIHKAYNRVKEGNFNIEGLVGFDIHQKTIGVVGFGNIGKAFAQLMSGFGGEILVYDPFVDKNTLPKYANLVELDELLKKSDIISLHCPLTADNTHMICEDTLAMMKPNVYIINTSRGGLIDTTTIIKALKSKSIAGIALDVYEYEKDMFFRDMSSEIIQDDCFERLLTFPNVLITGHQAFLTVEALNGIATTTLNNAVALEFNQKSDNLL